MESNAGLAIGFVNEGYVRQGIQGIKARQNLLKALLSSRSIPKEGWDDISIEYVINEISLMDSNNFLSKSGVGEREGRIFSGIVARRHFHLSHGIGRSGDLEEVQPKAAGSSLIYKLTSCMMLQALHISGMTSVKRCLLVPMATGMTLSLCMNTLKTSRPSAKYVIWPRIDQKSCFKSILTAGLIPLVVENKVDGDQIVTDLSAIEDMLAEHSNDSSLDDILCIMCTTR